MDRSMTIKEEIFDQIEELNCSLRELTDYELVDCRQALINRTNILMGLMDELCDSQISVHNRWIFEYHRL